jgi:hypothetical protein
MRKQKENLRSANGAMRKALRYLVAVCWFLLATVAADAKQYGFVPDEDTAIRIGRAELIKVYGKKKIQEEEPLTTKLQNGVWFVSGTLWCADGKGGGTNECLGGIAEIKIRQCDGNVLSIGHTK